MPAFIPSLAPGKSTITDNNDKEGQATSARSVCTSFCAICYPTNPAQSAVTIEDLKPKLSESVATFSGGCFWCTEADFEKIPGVTRVFSGFSGGKEVNPEVRRKVRSWSSCSHVAAGVIAGTMKPTGENEIKSLLTADIGGTNSWFAHFKADHNGVLAVVSTKWLPTSGADSFFQLLENLQRTDFTLSLNDADIAIIAAAGPVAHGEYSAPPYISWDIDLTRKDVKKIFRSAHLINDFIAQAYACRSPIGKSARSILPGEIKTDGVIGILGAGTALGKAILVPVSENDFVAFPSEGGHTLYPFVSRRECAFQDFYQQKSGQRQITGNLVVSGRGLRYLHWYLTGEELAPQEITARFDREPETLAWFAKFYGRACQDFALEVLSLGGLYIAGGVAARTPAILLHEDFRHEFLNSSTMGSLLAKIPLFLIDNQESGLWGAALYGQRIIQKQVQG